MGKKFAIFEYFDLRGKIGALAAVSLVLGLGLMYNSSSEVNRASKSKIDVERLKVSNTVEKLSLELNILKNKYHLKSNGHTPLENDTKSHQDELDGFTNTDLTLGKVNQLLEDKLKYWIASGAGGLVAGGLQVAISGWFLVNIRNRENVEKNSEVWLKGSMGSAGILLGSFSGFYFSDLRSDTIVATFGADFYTLNFLLMIANRLIKNHKKQKMDKENENESNKEEIELQISK